jgi:hypothetical protein
MDIYCVFMLSSNRHYTNVGTRNSLIDWQMVLSGWLAHLHVLQCHLSHVAVSYNQQLISIRRNMHSHKCFFPSTSINVHLVGKKNVIPRYRRYYHENISFNAESLFRELVERD